MRTLVLLLEEPSAREMLKGLLPQILPDTIQTQYVVFEGKQHLDKELVRRLRGWKRPNSSFVVLRDQDAGDCLVIKDSLLGKCQEAGHSEAVVRIACRELEAWYLGDLAAVETALHIQGLTKNQKKAGYRNPDKVVNPSSELRKLTRDRYQKVAGSRAIGPELNVDRNLSRSFQVFVAAIKSLFEVDGTDRA
ncbi:MAG: hypothetical protein ACI8P0_000034 [Planctomycetaceae bacterium]|jgi:hypothetical protein